jgi:hypothetical protein
MAEENLEGLDDLDSLLDEDAGGEAEEGGFAGELDDFLSDEEGAEEGPPAEEEEGEADSELDSFFEDLSTIDDLEVAQEEAPPEEEVPAAEPAEAAAAVAAVAAPAVAAAAPAAPAAPRERKPPSRFWRRIRHAIILGILAGGGYYAYITFFPDFEVPWPDVKMEDITKLSPFKGEEEPPAEPPKEEVAAMAPPPAPPPAPPQAAPPPRPVPAAPPPPPGQGYGVQVATCFFSTCVQGFQGLLQRNNRGIFVKETTTRSESLEIISRTAFTSRQAADEVVGRINREHRLEGQAYTKRAGNAYRISMGNFPELARANVVKDALNQRLGGEVVFASELRSVPYTLRKVVTGRFASRDEARRELLVLRKLDSRFRGSFIVRN